VREYDYSTPDNLYNKKFTVMINGYDFVNHTRYEPMAVRPRAAGDERNIMDAPGLYDIYFSNSGAQFNIYSTSLKGSLKGLIDIRDGNNELGTVIDPSTGNNYTTTRYKGIPFYMNKLNTLVRTFARAMNEGLNIDGQPIKGLAVDADGNPQNMVGHLGGYDYEGRLGQLLFTYTNNPDNTTTFNYNDLNCRNFTINPILTTAEGWTYLATSSDPAKGESNNDVILDFQKLSSYPSLFKEGKLLDFIIGTSDHMSIDRNQAINFSFSYQEITMQTDNQRLSVSGVDINEEMMAMIKYQQLYQAAAKLINVINSVYDIMINRLGVS
jgi:flagellar hook-associated protein 1 FlgK